MLLAIDEVINTTADSTIVVFGSNANVFDLPANLQGMDDARDAFYGNQQNPDPFYIAQGAWLIAPCVNTSTAPAPLSVLAAEQIFGPPDPTPPSREVVAKCMAYWPVDTTMGNNVSVPAYKQALVATPPIPGAPRSLPTAIWVFVIAADGSMMVQMIQLLCYEGVSHTAGQLKVGSSTYLFGIDTPSESPGSNQQPPATNHALNFVTWRLPAGVFKWQDLPGDNEAPYFAGQFPAAWGQGVSQTTLLSTKSTPFDIQWQDSGEGQAQDIGHMPSSPIMHMSLLVGRSISIKRPWLQDFSANLIAYTAGAQSTWGTIMACMLFVCQLLLDMEGELDWPFGGIADYCFDELEQIIDPGFKPPVPPWLV
ncbi:MAG: hypothetical protein V4463_23775 [Pseudomonadota bacterium]